MSEAEVKRVEEMLQRQTEELQAQLDRRFAGLHERLSNWTGQHEHQHEMINQRLQLLEGQFANIQGRLLVTAALVTILASFIATLLLVLFNHLGKGQ